MAALLLAPSLAQSQVQVNGTVDARAGTADPVAARNDDPAAGATPARRSLMGMVMDVLIESAEQQSARQEAERQPGRQARHLRTATGTASPPVSKPASGLAAREQIAVESEQP